jgi:hypothetical protein
MIVYVVQGQNSHEGNTWLVDGFFQPETANQARERLQDYADKLCKARNEWDRNDLTVFDESGFLQARPAIDPQLWLQNPKYPVTYSIQIVTMCDA